MSARLVPGGSIMGRRRARFKDPPSPEELARAARAATAALVESLADRIENGSATAVLRARTSRGQGGKEIWIVVASVDPRKPVRGGG